MCWCIRRISGRCEVPVGLREVWEQGGKCETRVRVCMIEQGGLVGLVD